jgi:peptidoglycan hydrolase-like protein with peptidoglycan-binding domain
MMWKPLALALLALAFAGPVAAAGRSDPQVVKLQQALRKHGADITADGRIGDDTHTAILNFQSSQGLPMTGKADPATLQKLGLASGAAAAPAAAPMPKAGGGKIIETQTGPVNATKIISPGRPGAK